MFIEQVVIDGFKSYATRTVISDWDAEFNAITGLNGSGKSNILDAICFVLGIQVLSNLRASTLQDLIYKKGQAGVEKASVTLIFNNEDVSKSPIGYETQKKISITRQIVVGGGSKNRYIINGSTAQQQKVFDLFQSVSLNVNNPHFLIMQGRITKVLNMKPPEILAMIEEAAGTRMFEDRKDKALKTIDKKQTKVQEIVELLNEVIVPKMNKLKEQKRAFLELQKVESELEWIVKVLVAFDFWKNQSKLDQSDEKLNEKEIKLKECTESIAEFHEEIKILESEIQETIDQKSSKSTDYKQLEHEFNEAANEMVKLKTQLNLKKQTIEEEEKNINSSNKTLKELECSITELEGKIKKYEKSFEVEKQDHDKLSADISSKEQLLQSLLTGISANENQEGGHLGQLNEVKHAKSISSQNIDKSKIRLSHLKKELDENSPKAKNAEKMNSGLVQKIESLKRDTEEIRKEVETLKVDLNEKENLEADINGLNIVYRSTNDTIKLLERELSSIKFQYSDPTPGFDRTQVKGLVAELVQVNPDFNEYSDALEICAGGSLYNVVVSTEQIGTQLLKNGKLKKRVTIIPLNKINSFKANAQALAAATKLSKGKANLALNLIGYEQDVEKAMEYVFGGTFICRDAKTAQELTFHPQIKMRSITMDGDLFDPSGLLSGGSKTGGSSAGLLLKMSELKRKRLEFSDLQSNLELKKASLSAILDKLNRQNSLNQKLSLKCHELKLVQDQLMSSSSSKVIQLVEDLKKQIEELEVEITAETKKLNELNAKENDIINEMKEFNQNKEDKLKELQNQIKVGKKLIQKNGPRVLERQREIDVAREELNENIRESDQIKKLIELNKKQIEILKEESKSQEEAMMKVKARHDQCEEALEEERRLQTAHDANLKMLDQRKNEKKQLIEDCKLLIQQLTHEINVFHQERKQSDVRVKELLKQHPWISDKIEQFNQPGEFNFEEIDTKDLHTRKSQLEEKSNSLKRNVNRDVMDTFERLEKKQIALESKLATIRKDKSKIETTITELDKYKREALYNTWKKVDSDFGAIFGELLPGNSSRLEPPEGQDITEGLQVKVCLGGVWKQSLTELSGGQRSLVALSLILSLLQFKPAPMYILDEIDSALDLSHTQNIGQLFKTRFKGSQFIVVSLKEGMFNNANVIFKTKFRDGLSMVERHSQLEKKSEKIRKSGKAPRNSASEPIALKN